MVHDGRECVPYPFFLFFFYDGQEGNVLVLNLLVSAVVVVVVLQAGVAFHILKPLEKNWKTRSVVVS